MKRGRKTGGIDMALPDGDVTVFIKYIRKNGKVIVGGLGSFEVVEIKPRTLYHNTAKRILTTKKYRKIKFTPSKVLKSIVNK
jgi:nucleoid DNA-binding protein